MIMDELEKLTLTKTISHWELATEDRAIPDGFVTIEVYRVFLNPWNYQTAKELADRFRELQCSCCLHPPLLVDGSEPHISVPLG
jgi:hypothetical protein